VVARDDLHRLFDELVTLFLESLTVTVLARVDTATEVVVLRRRRGRSGIELARVVRIVMGKDSPVAISRNNIVDPELLADLLNPQMGHVCIQLLSSHGRSNCGGQVHKASGLVVRCITPTITLATLLGAIRVQLRLFRHRLRAATTLAFVWRRGEIGGSVRVASTAAGTQRYVVGAGAASIVAPRHDDVARWCCDGVR
jgi:hypothetical protein